MGTGNGKRDRVVMGIDPGIATTGYGVLRNGDLVAAGKITTSPADPESLRYSILLRDLVEAMREHEVVDVAIEKFVTFYISEDAGKPSGMAGLATGNRRKRKSKRGKYAGPANPDSLYKMKGAQTTALLAAMLAGATVFEYTLQEWKGDARRSKDEIQEQVRLLYGADIGNHNVTDGIIIASHHDRLGRLHRDRGVRADLSDFASGLIPPPV